VLGRSETNTYLTLGYGKRKNIQTRSGTATTEGKALKRHGIIRSRIWARVTFWRINVYTIAPRKKLRSTAVETTFQCSLSYGALSYRLDALTQDRQRNLPHGVLTLCRVIPHYMFKNCNNLIVDTSVPKSNSVTEAQVNKHTKQLHTAYQTTCTP
jgi:hypothetical protein